MSVLCKTGRDNVFSAALEPSNKAQVMVTFGSALKGEDYQPEWHSLTNCLRVGLGIVTGLEMRG